MAKKKVNNYIDNVKFYDAFVKHKMNCTAAENSGLPTPRLSDYIGKCFMLIAEHLSYKVNFINYPFRLEMVGDAIENCVMAAGNFDPEKSKNAFGYFSKISYWAFLRRIDKEKKQLYVKHKALEQVSIDGFENVNETDKPQPSDSDYMKSFVTTFEKRHKIKK